MLMELKQQLKNGNRFPLTLTFEKAGKIDVSVWVEDMASKGGAEHKHLWCDASQGVRLPFGVYTDAVDGGPGAAAFPKGAD
jgi:hypothetical protein